MTSKLSMLTLSASILLNAYLLCFSPLEREPASNGDLLQTTIREILEMKKAKGDELDGHYIIKRYEDWPPSGTKMNEGIQIWHFAPDGSARNLSISPAQRWKNEDGEIHIQWPSEEYRYFGRFDGEYLTWDHGDYRDYYFKAE